MFLFNETIKAFCCFHPVTVARPHWLFHLVVYSLAAFSNFDVVFLVFFQYLLAAEAPHRRPIRQQEVEQDVTVLLESRTQYWVQIYKYTVYILQILLQLLLMDVIHVQYLLKTLTFIYVTHKYNNII